VYTERGVGIAAEETEYKRGVDVAEIKSEIGRVWDRLSAKISEKKIEVCVL
jgi:hypothetical protein